MTGTEPENTGKPEEGTETAAGTESGGESVARSRRRIAIWLTGPVVLIVLIVIGFAGYLASVGIDMAWAVGTSGWVAPPGTTLAGKNIGGKTLDEVDGILGELAGDFAGLSVWISEDPFIIDLAPGEAALSTFGNEMAISVVPMEIGISLDLNSMNNQVAALDEKSGNIWSVSDRISLWADPPEIPVVLSIDEDLARQYLEGVKSTVDCEPVNAELDLANRMVAQAKDGIKVDVEATLENIPTSLDEWMHIPVTLVVERTPAAIGNDAFEGFDLDNPLATYTTSFATYKRNRSYNISLISSHFEGAVIGPGEVFSFNQTTGPRGYDEGYLSAPMYINRRVEMEPAGGACQVSTTLYNAALLAGLEITERWPHSRPCSYVPYGRDATVAYPSVDIKFRNTLDHPIIIHQTVDYLHAGTITFEIFGHPDDRVHVEIGNAYSWLGRPDSSTTYILDTSLAPGQEVVEDSGVSGIHQRAWRTWFDEEGNELYTEELSNDNIRPVGAVIRHNPGPGGSAPGTSGGSGTVENPAPVENPEPSPNEPEPPPPGLF